MTKDFSSLTSYMGMTPVCDRCKLSIIEGDRIRQEFVGIAMKDEEGEFAISEQKYTLVHIICRVQ